MLGKLWGKAKAWVKKHPALEGIAAGAGAGMLVAGPPGALAGALVGGEMGSEIRDDLKDEKDD